ncbi:hypothetical protein RIF29_24681 [Crotalaria pallida]|uniref:Uncharacterized protein n=1 Tax=Crotalaria pallida TaxID=3830 RepID=A0AAN9EMG6_CROPI
MLMSGSVSRRRRLQQLLLMSVVRPLQFLSCLAVVLYFIQVWLLLCLPAMLALSRGFLSCLQCPPSPSSASSSSSAFVLLLLRFLSSSSTDVKTPDKEGFSALQIGCGHKKEKHLTKPEVCHFRAQGVPLNRKLREFPVTPDALLPLGTSLNVRHFVPDQYVDITGTTKGKGFQLSHRSGGSTGQRDAPGKVFPGKKMVGRMGREQRTVKNVWVYKIDPARNLMWVKGQ